MMICFRQQVRQMFGRVTRGMSRCDHDFTKCETVAVFYFFVLESVGRATLMAYENRRRFQPRAKFARTTYQIGMNMRLENMRDGEACFARRVYINIYVRPRIENRSDPFVIVTEEVRKFRDTFSLNGFKYERH